MRAFIVLLMLSGCATVFSAPPSERVAGCWIERTGGAATTMRWFASPSQAGALNGQLLRYAVDGAEPEARAFTLAQAEEGWRLCRVGDGEICWPVAEGRGGSLEGGRAFIDRFGERLRISVLDGAGEWEIFDGGRDGCD